MSENINLRSGVFCIFLLTMTNIARQFVYSSPCCIGYSSYNMKRLTQLLQWLHTEIALTLPDCSCLMLCDTHHVINMFISNFPFICCFIVALETLRVRVLALKIRQDKISKKSPPLGFSNLAFTFSPQLYLIFLGRSLLYIKT